MSVPEEAGKVLTSLPAQFLALVLLNVCFIAGLLWFLRGHEIERMEVIRQVLTACNRTAALIAPQGLP